MRTIGDLALNTEQIPPLATVSTAVRQLQERALRVVAVVENGQFIGVVTRDRAQLAAPDAPVKEIVQRLVIEMPASTPVRTAAKLFVENALDYVPVKDEDQYVGLLSANQLLLELGRSWDPMTGLSWSDRLRDWGVDVLQSGQEITIAFIDLNDFGAYNKQHGHIVGDRVLKAIASMLAGAVRSETDVLVRYGGDEFVIGSIRTRQEIEEALEEIANRPLMIEGVNEGVTFTVGYSGGKRTRERERTHFASTLDNLINLASRDSLSRKVGRSHEEPVPFEARAASGAASHVEVSNVDDEVVALASVSLGQEPALGTARGPKNTAIDVVAASVSQAVAKLRPGTTLALEDALVYRRWDGHPVAAVQVSVACAGSRTSVQASVGSSRGLYAALAEAIVMAVEKGLGELMP